MATTKRKLAALNGMATMQKRFKSSQDVIVIMSHMFKMQDTDKKTERLYNDMKKRLVEQKSDEDEGQFIVDFEAISMQFIDNFMYDLYEWERKYRARQQRKGVSLKERHQQISQVMDLTEQKISDTRRGLSYLGYLDNDSTPDSVGCDYDCHSDCDSAASDS